MVAQKRITGGNNGGYSLGQNRGHIMVVNSGYS